VGTVAHIGAQGSTQAKKASAPQPGMRAIQTTSILTVNDGRRKQNGKNAHGENSHVACC
jgi:hypothetical protein